MYKKSTVVTLTMLFSHYINVLLIESKEDAQATVNTREAHKGQ